MSNKRNCCNVYNCCKTDYKPIRCCCPRPPPPYCPEVKKLPPKKPCCKPCCKPCYKPDPCCQPKPCCKPKSCCPDLTKPACYSPCCKPKHCCPDLTKPDYSKSYCYKDNIKEKHEQEQIELQKLLKEIF